VHRVLVIVGATFFAGVTFGCRYLSFGGFSNDHFVHLARAQQMLNGAMPVRDYADSGLPNAVLTAAASAVAQVLFGAGLHSELLLVSGAFAVAAAVSYLVASRVSGSVLLAIAGASVPVLAYPVSYSYPKVLPYVVTLAVGWSYATTPSTARLAMLAASVVVGFLFRHDHGVILGAVAVAAVLARHGFQPKSAWVLGALASLGVLLAGPYLAWVQVHQGLGLYVSEGAAIVRREVEKADLGPPAFAINRDRPLFSRLAAFPRGPVVKVRWTPAVSASYMTTREDAHGLHRLGPVGPATWNYELSSWSSSALEGLVRDPAVADTDGINRSEFTLVESAPSLVARILSLAYAPDEGLRQAGVAALYYLAWGFPFASALLLAFFWHDVSPARRTLVVMATVMQVAMCETMLRDPLVTRVRDVVVPFAVLLPFVVSRLWRGASRPALTALARTVATVLLILVLGSAAATAPLPERARETGLADGWEGITQRAAEVRNGFAPPHERTGERREPIVDYLRSCTQERSRMLVMTFGPELLFYTGRGFAAGHESLVPGFHGSQRQMALMLDRLDREDVPFVIMDSETNQEMAGSFPPVYAYVTSHYREVARFPIAGEKSFIVLVDANRSVVRTFGDERLPCFAPANAPGELGGRNGN
jgi:hypothetical protein